MHISRALFALALGGAAAAQAQQLQPLIDRPLTLPRGTLDLVLHGTYHNWATGAPEAPLGDPRPFFCALSCSFASISGETLALAIDYGSTDQAQVGLGLAFPINPGAGFGSVVLNGMFSTGPLAALRVDVGYERIGLNGDPPPGSNHVNRYFGGLGARIRIPISPTVAFVTGRTGAAHLGTSTALGNMTMGHFNNIGDSGFGFYFGSTFLTEASSDFFVLSAGDNSSGTYIGFNLPAGLLLQPDPHFALTLQAGYSVAIEVSSRRGSAQLLYFFPVGMEAVVTPTPRLDIGARFFIEGYVGESGLGGGSAPGYFDLRALMLWFRIHIG